MQMIQNHYFKCSCSVKYFAGVESEKLKTLFSFMEWIVQIIGMLAVLNVDYE